MFSFQGMDKREIVVALAGLYRRQVCIAAAVIVSVALLLKPALTGVGAGIVWSLLDSLLLVISVLKGFNRMSEQELKFRVFMNFVKRLALALVMLYLVHRYNAGIVWMLVVFTLMHLALSRRRKAEGREERRIIWVQRLFIIYLRRLIS